jgi:hypothetical protein
MQSLQFVLVTSNIGKKINDELQNFKFLIISKNQDIEFLRHCNDRLANMSIDELFSALLM